MEGLAWVSLFGQQPKVTLSITQVSMGGRPALAPALPLSGALAVLGDGG